MATTADHAALLDQLQTQLNTVLEHTGRVFGALSSNPKSPPTAQLTKLKSVLPVASNNFHEALDKLESELQLAQAVMRRDLAVCRERSGQLLQPVVEPIKPEQQAVETAAPQSKVETAPASEPDVKPTQLETKASEPEAPEDIIMEDADQDDDDTKHMPALSFDELIADDKLGEPTPPLAESKPSVAAHTLQTTTHDLKPANGGLQLDIKPSTEDAKATDGPPSDEDKAPDTANDLDSLFNDPMSAGAAGGENPDFNFGGDGSNDIDFGSFGANFDANGSDNDNISSLLPGLEDYANTQSNNDGTDVDLNTLFGVGDTNNGMDSQGAGEQRDSTFEELMEMANLDGMDSGSAGNINTTADFDFDSLFN